MSKKTLVQITKDSVVVAEDVVGITTGPSSAYSADVQHVFVMLAGGHSVPVPLEDGVTLLDVTARLFDFTVDQEATSHDGD